MSDVYHDAPYGAREKVLPSYQARTVSRIAASLARGATTTLIVSVAGAGVLAPWAAAAWAISHVFGR
jgi:hypothetical protein